MIRKASPLKEQMSEFSIYAYQQSESGCGRPWKKLRTVSNKNAAMKRGKALIRSGCYACVEIQEKYFDRDMECIADRVVKIFEHKKIVWPNIYSAGLIAVLIGLLSLSTVYYLE